MRVKVPMEDLFLIIGTREVGEVPGDTNSVTLSLARQARRRL